MLPLLGSIALWGCSGSAGSKAADSDLDRIEPISTAGVLPENAVFPTAETIESGEYVPLSRPLYVYVNKQALKSPETVAFLRFYYSDASQPLVSEVGYIPLSATMRQETVRILEEAIREAGGQVPDTQLRGKVTIDGSSTVYPVTQAVAEEFSKIHRRIRVPVGVSGTGGGFKKFCNGETDINNASRPISPKEIELCAANGIDFLELKCCIDGLTVIVNPQNDWVRGLTVEQLREIWKPDSTVEKWNDIDPAFPNQAIKLFGPDTDSGTFDYFTEAICGKSKASRSDYQQSSDDNFLVIGIVGDRHALAYFGYAYYIENSHKLKALAIAP